MNPNNNASHPSSSCVLKAVLVWLGLCLDNTFGEELNQFSRPMIMKVVISECVLLAWNQQSSSDKRCICSVIADGDWHCSTCVVSSSGRLHNGQFESNLCFLCTITMPVAVVLLTHFVIAIVGRCMFYCVA